MSRRQEAMRNRSSLPHKLRFALSHPARVPDYLRRLSHDLWLRTQHHDHTGYYRAIMRSRAAQNPEAAVGSVDHQRWLAVGQLQFDYLVEHGLTPDDRMLEIGCGNLRAGRLFIAYLKTGNYYGIDISPDILLAAQDTLVGYDLHDKLPHLTPVRDLRFAFLPNAHFTVIHAHSVFSHCPLEVIEECFAHVGRILAPHGWFDFTFNRTDGTEHHVLREDFYYRTETLINMAERYGFIATFQHDWEQRPHKQSKIRLTHRQKQPP